MIAVVLAGVLALATPDPSCTGADISVTALRITVVKGTTKTNTPDRYLITADLTNIGMLPQQPHVPQHAELVRDGNVVATQSLPALASGVTYPLQFRVFRDVAQRKDPLEVLVRYVLDDKSKTASNNCSSANDAMQKIF
jgi:hypothetical protein